MERGRRRARRRRRGWFAAADGRARRALLETTSDRTVAGVQFGKRLTLVVQISTHKARTSFCGSHGPRRGRGCWRGRGCGCGGRVLATLQSAIDARADWREVAHAIADRVVAILVSLAKTLARFLSRSGVPASAKFVVGIGGGSGDDEEERDEHTGSVRHCFDVLMVKCSAKCVDGWPKSGKASHSQVGAR
jgi:hypothetical protein